MVSYDLYVKTGNLDGAVRFAGDLGWNGLCFVVPYTKSFRKRISELRIRTRKRKLDVAFGVEIDAAAKNTRKITREIRKDVELILASGGSPEANRKTLEDPMIDILTQHTVSGKCGINHVLARLAKKNNIAILFNFSHVLHSYGRTRSVVLATMLETAKFVKRFGAPFLLSSGAESEWDLRSPSELTAFGKFLGFREPAVRESLSGRILLENRKRLSKKWIMPGVEIE